MTNIKNIKHFKMCIYMATNMNTGKCYIGQTTGILGDRINSHYAKNSACPKFKNAIQKYGKENFLWEVIHTCSDIDELNLAEVYYIDFYDSINKGYNLTSGGLNTKASDESRRKMSLSQLGRKHSIETRQKMSMSATGVRKTDEMRRKLSEIKTGTKASPETRAKLSAARKGRQFSESAIVNRKINQIQRQIEKDRINPPTPKTIRKRERENARASRIRLESKEVS